MTEKTELLQMQTVIQSVDIVTSVKGQTPVILIDGEGEILGRVAMAINFLRSGTNGVQIVRSFPYGPDGLHDNGEKFRTDLKKWFSRFEFEGEKFLMNKSPKDPIYFFY